MNPTLLNRIALILAFAGLFVAGVLSLGPLLNVAIPCGVSGGCDAVANHPSSKWFGIPVAYFGFAAYAALAGLAAVRAVRGLDVSRPFVQAGFLISGVGALASLYLTYYSVTVIGATCNWCLVSAVIMVLLAIVHAVLMNANLAASPANSLDLKLTAGLALLTLLALGIQGSKLEERGTRVAVRTETLVEMTDAELVPEDGHALGPADAPMTIVEFADLTCHHCQLMYPQVKSLTEKSDGKVRLVYRHFPLYHADNQVTLPAAIASEFSAEKGRFWQFLDAMFGAPEPIRDPNQVLEIVRSLNLDPEEFKRRIGDGEDSIVKRVQRDRSVADKLGLTGTPTFIIITKEHGREMANNNTLFEILDQEKYKKILGR